MIGRRAFFAGTMTSTIVVLNGCGDGQGGSGSSIDSIASVTPTSALTPIPTPTPTPTPTPVSTTAVLVQSGDSIGTGATTNYVAFDHLGFPASVLVRNVSSFGRQLAQAYAARETEFFPLCDRTVPCTLLIQIGTNDLGSDVSADDLYNRLASPFVQSSRAIGFYVVVDTILPRADGGWTSKMETQRLAYRLIRGNAAGADATNDIAADPVIGDGSGPDTSPYHTDALHPSTTGQQRPAAARRDRAGPVHHPASSHELTTLARTTQEAAPASADIVSRVIRPAPP